VLMFVRGARSIGAFGRLRHPQWRGRKRPLKFCSAYNLDPTRLQSLVAFRIVLKSPRNQWSVNSHRRIEP
jgi:hypothetical protein